MGFARRAGAGAGSSRSSCSCRATSARAGRAAELLAQQHADVLVDAQRLVDVAAGAQDLHQRGAGRLAVRLRLDGGAGGLLGLGPGGAAEPGAGDGERLQRLHAQVGELAAAGVDPRRLEPGQQAALGDLDRLAGRPPTHAAASPLSSAARAARTRSGATSQSIQASLGQDQLQLGAPFQHARAERLAQAAERRGEQRLVGGRRALAGPQRLGELVAADRAVAVQREVGEQQPALASAQRVFEPPSLELHDESPA